MKPLSSVARMALGVWIVAFAVRVLHIQSLLADPLFYHPLGGNVPYLLEAERLAGGAFLPEGAFTHNSPLYPYVLAAVYKVFGVGSLYAVRLVGAVLDAGTAVLVALLATRHFGRGAGWAAGLAFALYGPAIFFSGELAPVSHTLFLVTLGILLLDTKGRRGAFVLAGLALGLAAGLRPNVLLAGLAALAVPWIRGLEGARRHAAAIGLGLALGLAPVPAMNYAASGGFTLLTLSGGHNLYIGHNPAAEPQYALPAALDGDVFASMKALAEEAEGRTLRPDEVSGYYTRRAVSYALRHPLREAELAARRTLLLVNRAEATTYANPGYQRHYSYVLRWSPGFAWLFALAVPGMVLGWGRPRAHLWIPVVVAAASVLGFFYIARLRVVMVPSLAIFAGAALARAATLGRSGARRALAAAGVLALVGFGLASLPLLPADPSNDWNKAGGVLRAMGRYAEAEEALERAREANPRNPNTYLNLAVLYRELGREAEAEAADARARALRAGAAGERRDFLEAVREGR